MSYDTVRVSQIASGAITTATGLALPGPRGRHSVQLTAWTTGTSINGATVVLQATNDTRAWIALASATVLATNAGTATSANGVGILSTAAYAFIRAVITNTGTGHAEVTLAA